MDQFSAEWMDQFHAELLDQFARNLHYLGEIFLYSPEHVNLDKSLEYFEKAYKYIRVDEEAYLASIQASDQHKKLMKNDQAAEIIRPRQAGILCQIGIVFYAMNNLEKALEYFNKAIEAYGLDEAYINKTRVLTLLKRYDEARDTIRPVILSNSELFMVCAIDSIISPAGYFAGLVSDLVSYKKNECLQKIHIFEKRAGDSALIGEKIKSFYNLFQNSRRYYEYESLLKKLIEFEIWLYKENKAEKSRRAALVAKQAAETVRQEREQKREHEKEKKMENTMKLLSKNQILINEIRVLQKNARAEWGKQDCKVLFFTRNYNNCMDQYKAIIQKFVSYTDVNDLSMVYYTYKIELKSLADYMDSKSKKIFEVMKRYDEVVNCIVKDIEKINIHL